MNIKRVSILKDCAVSYSSNSIPKGELMPQTKEQYLKIMERDAYLILKQGEEINKLKQTINDLRQKIVRNV